jgi:hypothetical protein
MLLSNDSKDVLVDQVEQIFISPVISDDFAIDLESFTEKTLITKDFDLQGFARLMAGINMDFETLYVGYVGKNVLNFFRQDYGYKDGSYVKQWNGVEDNEHLVQIVSMLDTSSSAFAKDLYTQMELRYKELCS